jgi:hypothetical protein
MKLRIQGNSLRLRLTRSEVARLQEHGVVEEIAQFKADGSLTYRVQRRAATDAVQADLHNGAITVHIPAGAFESWAGSEEVGLYAQDGPLRIAIEKDFRCLTHPREEEARDAYPHPADQFTT